MYFNFVWNHAWMDDQKAASGSGWLLKVKLQVWNSMDPSQTDRDSHGRREDGSPGQWEDADRIYPAGYTCEAKVCACNLVTGLGTNSLSVRDIADWSVYTTKVHGPTSFNDCTG